MRSALESGDLERIAASMVNDLQESAIRLHPEIGDAMALLRRSGAVGAVMSGSGSTVFGLVPNEARGREIAAFLKSQGFAAWSVHAIVP
jgi:4-diphosphocytidyl-2-C-methyl-D-erythritol kinase